jgi:hypothetical protein
MTPLWSATISLTGPKIPLLYRHTHFVLHGDTWRVVKIEMYIVLLDRQVVQTGREVHRDIWTGVQKGKNSVAVIQLYSKTYGQVYRQIWTGDTRVDRSTDRYEQATHVWTGVQTDMNRRHTCWQVKRQTSTHGYIDKCTDRQHRGAFST